MKRIKSDRDMMTPREVANETGIGLNAVYHLLKERHIPSISVGRDMLIPRPQYQRWLETVTGNFDGVSTRNHKKPRVQVAKSYSNGYWAGMTPEQRSQEMQRRFALARKRREKTHGEK